MQDTAPPKSPITFDRACARLEPALLGSVRRDIVAEASTAPTLGDALLRLRDSMRSNVWKSGSQSIDLGRIVRTYDSRTRDEGFHALHDWDGKADTVLEDTIPVDVLHYLIRQRGTQPPDPAALAILLDYYFMHLLSLFALRIWDEGDADENLDRVDHLLRELQGPNGSGQRFVENAETLILIATSHYEVVEQGYDTLLERVRTLNRPHRATIALTHAASMGSHLRFGFEATYARDTIVMRNDNVADYPWLCFAVSTVMDEYERVAAVAAEGVEQEIIVEALLNGLSPDARAFVGDASAPLVSCEGERLAFRERFHAHRDALVAAFERHRPSGLAYSPLSFFFNFSHNVLKGIVVDALLRGRVWPLTFNDLLTALCPDAETAALKRALAETLMGYARSAPDRIRGRLMPVIVYDPSVGQEAFGVMLRKIRE